MRSIRVSRGADVLREEPPDLGRAESLLLEVLALPDLRLELPIARDRLVAISLAPDRSCFIEIEHATERWAILTTISRGEVDEVLVQLFAGHAPEEIPPLRDAQWTGGPLAELPRPEKEMLVMTPALRKAIELLQMSREELVELVRQELLSNPVASDDPPPDG